MVNEPNHQTIDEVLKDLRNKDTIIIQYINELAKVRKRDAELNEIIEAKNELLRNKEAEIADLRKVRKKDAELNEIIEAKNELLRNQEAEIADLKERLRKMLS